MFLKFSFYNSKVYFDKIKVKLFSSFNFKYLLCSINTVETYISCSKIINNLIHFNRGRAREKTYEFIQIGNISKDDNEKVIIFILNFL